MEISYISLSLGISLGELEVDLKCSRTIAIFGKGDLYLGVEGIKSFFPKSYGDPLENKENELTLGYKKLIPLEIEVFQLSWTFIKKCILFFYNQNI